MLKNYVFAFTTLACLTLLTSCEHETHAAGDQGPCRFRSELQQLWSGPNR